MFSTLLAVPYFIMLVLVVGSCIASFFFKDDRWFGFFNLEKILNHKLFLPVLIANIALAVVGWIFPPILLLKYVTEVIILVVSYYWLYDCWKSGHFRKWLRWLDK